MSQTNQNNNNFKDTKIFVGGLTWRTTTDDLRNFFQARFGEVIDANVVSEGLPGGNLRSKGYGFVVFRDPESANTACQLPWPVIDGRQTNVNMAYIGAKNNTNQSNQNGLLNHAAPHQSQLVSQYPYPHFPQPYWAPYYGHHPSMYNVPCYSYPTAMMHQYVLAYRMQRNWQRMNNLTGVIISDPPNEEINEANEEVNEANEEIIEANEENIEANEDIEEIIEANEEINAANEEVNEANEENIEANEDLNEDVEEIIEEMNEEINEEEADTETDSDQEGEISGEDNDIKEDVKDQELEIMSGQEDDTKQEVDLTKQLVNGVELTLQIEIVCEEEAENTPQENGDGHEENRDQEGEEHEYMSE
ncbi:hypothetical protein Bca101_054626 [Brassica carinata]